MAEASPSAWARPRSRSRWMGGGTRLQLQSLRGGLPAWISNGELKKSGCSSFMASHSHSLAHSHGRSRFKYFSNGNKTVLSARVLYIYLLWSKKTKKQNNKLNQPVECHHHASVWYVRVSKQLMCFCDFVRERLQGGGAGCFHTISSQQRKLV